MSNNYPCICEPLIARSATTSSPIDAYITYKITQVALWGAIAIYSTFVFSRDVWILERRNTRRRRRVSGLRVASLIHVTIFIASILRVARYFILLFYPGQAGLALTIANSFYFAPFLLIYLSFSIVLFFWASVIEFHSSGKIFHHLLGRFRRFGYVINALAFITWAVATIGASSRTDQLYVFSVISLVTEIFVSYFILILLALYGAKGVKFLNRIRATRPSTHRTTMKITYLTAISVVIMGILGTVFLVNLIWMQVDSLWPYWLCRSVELLSAVILIVNIDFDRFKRTGSASRASRALFVIASGLVELEDDDLVEVECEQVEASEKLKADIPLLADDGDIMSVI